MMNYVYVAVGSAIGGVARFVVGSWAQSRLDDAMPRVGAVAFPIGTLIVNVTGSLLLGAILVVVARQQGESANATRLLVAVGLCGGYTTFSTFSAETLGLMEKGGSGLAMLNVVASVALGVAAVFAGAFLARAALGRPA
ncbi:MAG: protein CrcB [Gemmatimonadetes bacterium]|nr:protein CrcB [Gemmatimonadota bacterium]